MKLYEKDTDSSDPNQAIKGYWPSASLWRTCVVLAARISPRAATEVINGVKDDEIRASQRVAFAISLAGGQSSNYLVIERRKSGESRK